MGVNKDSKHSSLEYRKNRMKGVQQAWGGNLVSELFLCYEIPKKLFEDLSRAVGLYIARAMDFDYSSDETVLLAAINASRENRRNITPNGGVVPKSEYSLEYNLVIRAWCELARAFTSNNPSLLRKFRLTPNIRIKFGQELEENRGRGLDTALPHSDAWVEGPWGMNCHIPILGDVEQNYLHFYKLKDETLFRDDFLSHSPDYTSMQWTLDFYEDDCIKPRKGCLHFSDYSLPHKTKREPGAGTRVSIDTTMFVGDHDVLPDREAEYLDRIPRVGDELILKANISETEAFGDKKSTFSHYTTGNVNRHWLS